MICQKHSNPRFWDTWWAKMIQLPRKHYSHQDVTFHPALYLKTFGIEKNLT
jgi:hypothetical protein